MKYTDLIFDLYGLISVANILNIDVFKSLKQKEQININRKWKINSENQESSK